MSYRSLEEVYAQKCANKPVVPLQRHTITERYTITLKDADNVAVDQEITPDLFNKFRREISRTSGVQIDSQSHTVNEVIDMIMKVDQWHVKNKNYEGGFLGPVLNLFNTVDVDPTKFAALYQLQTNPNNLIRSELVDKPGAIHSLYTLLPKEYVDVFSSHEDAIKVFNGLYEINPPIAGVTLGKGEIALSFISDSVKGSKGDLAFGQIGDVEVKGSGGRLGGDGFAVKQSATKINHTLQFVGSSLSDVDVRGIRADLVSKLNTMMSTISNPNHLQVLKDLASKINHDSTVQDIENHITSVYTKGLMTLIKPLHTRMMNMLAASNRTEAFSLTEAINLFFRSLDQLPYDKFIDGVVSLRNYQANDQINSITAAVRSLIPESKFKAYSDPKKYAPLVGTLHLVCYYLQEKFSRIIFINNETKNAICFKPEEDVTACIKAAYEFFTSNPFTFAFSVDEARRGAAVTFNG